MAEKQSRSGGGGGPGPRRPAATDGESAPPPARSITFGWEIALIVAVLLIAAGLRLWYSARLPIESDEAVVGLMARHILQGERPIFYYGQSYLGALEAYLVALAFSIGGDSLQSMRAVTIAFAVAFCALVYLLGRRIAGPAVGLVGALYAAFPPVFLTIWSIKVRFGFVETVVLGTILLVLLHDVAWKGRLEFWRLAVLGLVAGLAFWVSQLILPYLIVVGLFAVLRLGARSGRVAIVAVPAFLIGSAPLWPDNLATGFATFRQLLSMHVGGADAPLAYLRSHVYAVVVDSLPVVLGFVEPRFDLPVLRAERIAQLPAFYLGLVGAVGLGLVVLWWLVATVRRGWRGLIDRPESPLVALGALTLLAVVLSNNLRYWWGEPRYLLPIYTTIPFFAAYLVALGRRSRLAFGLLLAFVLLVNARGNFLGDPVAALPTVEYRGTEYSRIPMDTVGLAAVLLERGDTRVYTDYWIAYVLTFESQERILVAPITNQFSLSVVRLADQVDAVRQSSRAACVFVANTQLEQEFARQMAANGVRYERTEASGFAIYDALDPPWHPVD